jgi:hypothetical protein
MTVTAVRLAPQPTIERATRPWMEPIGVSALLLAGLGLVCALSYSLSFLVIWLSAVSLLLGLLSLVRLFASKPCRAVVPVAGAVAGGVVLLTAVLLPSMLGPSYLAYRTRKMEDLTTIRAVPLAAASSSAPTDPNWVDASRAALQQGRLRVQIVSVVAGPELTNLRATKPVAKKKTALEEVLFIRLRIQRQVDMGADAVQETLADEKEQPKLTDNAGKEYRQRDVQEATAETKGRKAFPTALVDHVLVFEAPAGDVGYLRLELPAASWGGTGLFRFTIPSSMIRRADASGEVPGG